MKTMKHTTKTNHKLLSLNDLGGGIGFAVTSSFTYRYRAFRRCQMMAQAEGSVRFRPPDADGNGTVYWQIADVRRKILPHGGKLAETCKMA